MAPPSPLAISTASLTRLVKEEASYHKEMQLQEARIRKLEGQMGGGEDEEEEEGNREFRLKQEVRRVLSSFFVSFFFPVARSVFYNVACC